MLGVVLCASFPIAGGRAAADPSPVWKQPAAQGQSPVRQDQMPIYRAGVEMVVLNVSVLDDDGAPVTDLSADDFRISQDGQPQELSLFATSADTPLDVALVLDGSGSIRENAPSVREDAMAFLQALGPRDCVYFVPFRESVGRAAWAAPDDPILAALIGGMTLEGGTALYDSLYEALSSIDRSGYASPPRDLAAWSEAAYDGDACGTPLPPRSLGIPDTVRRTAVVVLSDGGDEHSLATYADTLVNAWSYPAPIFAVAIGDALGPRRRGVARPGTLRARRLRRMQQFADELESRLDHLAHISGGRLILGRDRDDVREEFAAVVGMLRSTYLIGYYPPEEDMSVARGGLVWHGVTLQSTRDDLDILVRPGYYRRLVDTRAAEQAVRVAVGLLDEGQPEAAIERLEGAVLLDAGYWPSYVVRGRAHLAIDQPERARDDLARALDLRPGLGSVHALLARTAHDLQEYDLAWYHAIRAHQDGLTVAALLRALQETADPPADLDEQLQASRLFVDVAPTPDALDQATMLEILRDLRQQISDAPDIALITRQNDADAGLVLAVDKLEGSPRKLEGDLVLYFAPYQEWEREKLEIADVDDPLSVSDGLAEALGKVRRRLGELR